jgi:hypothetical protein
VVSRFWQGVAGCLALSACAHNRTDVPYFPNPNVSEPAKVIERVIRSQPPAWAGPVPYEVIVKSDCIELRTTERGGFLSRGSPGEVRSAICYQNIGKVVLNKTDIWFIEIKDRLGYWMCYVYSFDESEAKLFIDAMYTMIGKQ